MASLLEVAMLLLFGASWPISVYKSWTSRKNGGKSLLFLCFIWTGYVCGLVGKFLFSPSYVIIFYCVNLLFVTVDILLYLCNRSLES